ncbi:MAG: carbohydrate kinase family protein [Proteobacteria bacterium]|nr:carbohydrate kinase family protein [Pseudomonadota bacterium]
MRDELFVVDDIRSTAGRTRYRQRAVGPGGMVSTALAQAAALGCAAQLVTAVGRDREGEETLRELRRLGVDTRRVVRDPSHPTTTSVVLVDAKSAERRFLLPDRSRHERGVELSLAGVARAQVLLVDGHYPVPALAAVRRAREAGVPVVGDFADARPGIRRLLPYVDFPIVPEEFCAEWGADARATLQQLASRFGGQPVVTQGARGALAWADGRVRRVPARRVPRRALRDTTGAGDVFHGAFAAGLSFGRGVPEALQLAARAAAKACTALGGTGHLPR